MSEQHEAPFARFLRMHPEYPLCSEANVTLFKWIKEHGGNTFTFDSFAAGWTALKSELIQMVSSLNAERFLAEYKEYVGGEFNGGLMDAFIASQIGRDRVWSVENYFQAYEHLSSEGAFATEIEHVKPKKKTVPIQDAMSIRETEEAQVRKLRKMAPIGKPVPKALRALATKERRENVGSPERLSHQDKFPEAVHI